MKSLPLRDLVRNPKAVKKLTSAGQTVAITDNGRPLWIIQAAGFGDEGLEHEDARIRAVEQILDEVASEPRPSISLAAILDESRR